MVLTSVEIGDTLVVIPDSMSSWSSEESHTLYIATPTLVSAAAARQLRGCGHPRIGVVTEQCILQ